ncbi:MAG TPA: MFS transporter [Acidimicrobiales bacterium]|nr:MFS transporter [Acidimicrobiales bacterium]
MLCTSLLVVSLDNTILNVALPSIARAFHATSSQMQWVVDAYAVVFAGLLLVLGSVGDHIGRKRVFLAGLLVFGCGSAASAFAGSTHWLIVARASMGVGGAAIMPSTLAILTNVFVDDGDRARAIGIWSGTTGIGVAVGPIVGGWLLAHYWWGSVFLVNVPIVVVGAVAAFVLVPDSRDGEAKRPDVVGGVLSTSGMGLLLWSIIEAPSRGWSSAPVLGALSGSLLVLGGFVAWERASSHPMLDLSFFSSRRFSAAIASLSFVIFALMGALFLLTQWLQFSLGYSPFAAGIRVGPVAAVILVAAPLSMLLVRAVGTKAVVGTGMAGIATGLWLLSRTTVDGTYRTALPALLLLGVGTGLAFAPCTDSVMGSVPRQRTGVASGTNGTALQLGGALGVGVLGSLLSTRYQDRIGPVLAHRAVPGPILRVIDGSLLGALEVAQRLGGTLGGELAALARRSFVSGMDLALVVGAVVVAVGASLAVALLPSRADAHGTGHGGDPGDTGAAGGDAA